MSSMLQDIFVSFWEKWFESDLNKCITLLSATIFTVNNMYKLINDEKYSKRPMVCYVTTFTLTMVSSPYIGAFIGYFGPISFPIILGINHYPILMKKYKSISNTNIKPESKEESKIKSEEPK